MKFEKTLIASSGGLGGENGGEILFVAVGVGVGMTGGNARCNSAEQRFEYSTTLAMASGPTARVAASLRFRRSFSMAQFCWICLHRKKPLMPVPTSAKTPAIKF